MAVENYHLKWDSHLSYLNSSVATLYKNEKFADVVLYSSSSSSNSIGGSGNNTNGGNNPIDQAIPTVGISAHKFILSSCSQFFATMFDNGPIAASNGVLYVVLPPDLSYRAIQILVQYIYTGEATVSNDILNEVLRGGEILKIRGLCRTANQREAAGSSIGTTNSNTSSCSSSVHYGTNGRRPQHMPPPPAPVPTVMTHSSGQLPNAPLAPEIYVSNKCTAQNSTGPGSNGTCSERYGVEHISHPHSTMHSQFRGLGASVMPKSSPVIVKSPKVPPMALLPPPRENKPHHGSGITVNKEVAIDPEEKCCYQPTAAAVAVRQHETLQLSMPPPHGMVVMNSGSMCTDASCKSCPLNPAPEPEKLRQRRRHYSQSDELVHRLASVEPLEREYADDRCERTDIPISYNRRSRNSNEQVPSYFVNEHFDQTQQAQSHSKPSKQYMAEPSSIVAAVTTASTTHLQSPPLYPHNFLAIKQEPVDWTTPQPPPVENTEELLDGAAGASPQLLASQSPKQPLDFKIPVGNAANVKIEVVASSHSADEDESPPGPGPTQYNSFSRLICDVCKKSFDEPKLWVQHLETHTTTPTVAPSTTTNVATNAVAPASGTGGSEPLVKSYVPKKRRRVSQQENSMVDHVTLLCDLCNTSFDTPAEWVRHMNNQHTEIELAMFNSKKDNEQKTTSATSIACSGSSRNHHHHHHQHQLQQQSHKKYSSRTSLPSAHSSNNNPLLQKRNHASSNNVSSSPPPETSSGIAAQEYQLRSTPPPLSPSHA